MNFINRLYFFSFGIILGVVIIIFSLGNRKEVLNFNYLPNKRVKSYLIKKQVSFTAKSICRFTLLGLDTMLLNEYITQSDVDFKSSKIRGYINKEYHLSFQLNRFGINTMAYLIFEKNNDDIQLVNLKLEKLNSGILKVEEVSKWASCD
tara:strand:- start:24 stop:470 length:447 start_codon:yes stop_codon:yes gene_type:complete